MSCILLAAAAAAAAAAGGCASDDWWDICNGRLISATGGYQDQPQVVIGQS